MPLTRCTNEWALSKRGSTAAWSHFSLKFRGSRSIKFSTMADEEQVNGAETVAVEETMEGVEGETETDVPVATEEPDDGAGASEGDRTLFVGGLSWDTTARDLKEYFGKYGEIVKGTIKTDPDTNRSRGFGFILFATTTSIDKVLAEKEHRLQGRPIDPKRANPKPPMKKVFVGGVDPDMSEADIREFFVKFGKIDSVELPFDKMKGARRKFCFIEFETEAGANAVLDKGTHSLGSKDVQVKKATPPQSQQRGGPGGARGGGGGRGFGGGRGAPRGRGGPRGGGWGGSSWGGGGGWDQGYGQGGSGYYDYNQGYGSGGYDGYGGGGGYDYNYGGQGGGYGGSWGGGYDQSYGGGYGGGYGKSMQPKRGVARGYHPYGR